MAIDTTYSGVTGDKSLVQIDGNILPLRTGLDNQPLRGEDVVFLANAALTKQYAALTDFHNIKNEFTFTRNITSEQISAVRQLVFNQYASKLFLKSLPVDGVGDLFADEYRYSGEDASCKDDVLESGSPLKLSHLTHMFDDVAALTHKCTRLTWKYGDMGLANGHGFDLTVSTIGQKYDTQVGDWTWTGRSECDLSYCTACSGTKGGQVYSYPAGRSLYYLGYTTYYSDHSAYNATYWLVCPCYWEGYDSDGTFYTGTKTYTYMFHRSTYDGDVHLYIPSETWISIIEELITNTCGWGHESQRYNTNGGYFVFSTVPFVYVVADATKGCSW